MKKQSVSSDKKLKVAEAGILFTLILGLTIFLGVHFSGEDEITPVTSPSQTTSEVSTEMAQPTSEIEFVAESEEGMEAPIVEEVIEEVIAPEPRIVTYSMAEQAYFDNKGLA